MTRRFAAARLLLAAAVVSVAPALSAVAADLPTLFTVTNVKAGDSLNVRPTPGTAQAPLTTLPPGTRDIEVVARDSGGSWGRVNRGETTGWVNMRHMSEQPGVWHSGALPATLVCRGTEPFWSGRPVGGQFVVSRMGEADERLDIRSVTDTGPRGRIATLGDTRVLDVTPAACSDGMSDAAFGLSARLGLASGALRGCCSVQP